MPDPIAYGLVWLVSIVWFLSPMELNKPEKPNELNGPKKLNQPGEQARRETQESTRRGGRGAGR
jgi:hypothetical protein